MTQLHHTIGTCDMKYWHGDELYICYSCFTFVGTVTGLWYINLNISAIMLNLDERL